MGDALGLVETKGLVAMIEAADTVYLGASARARPAAGVTGPRRHAAGRSTRPRQHAGGAAGSARAGPEPPCARASGASGAAPTL